MDLGGSNLRVVSVELDGACGMTVTNEWKETIPIDVMKSHGEGLFDFIAGLIKRASPKAGSPLGFTFSFPVNQTSLKSGTLMQWTKGYGSLIGVVICAALTLS